ncbi:hypothetical protein SAMN04488056_111192 [Cohaesibacter marisflavi]|uniref:Uncharacterized protein n=1 Tax=Cohaesibacter marisflavi TaxID=655353 RepID=A0A1I5JJ38_9HYPH|nr:hypothetical protein [Cohaesibacter marisflavi]SFO72775.1 hypothetical protein SAMN04488056_111192 [Cohaesibacter marisflavi]
MCDIIEKVKITLEYEVSDLDALFEAAREALKKLRTEAISEFGEDCEILYTQPIEQLIKEQLFDEDSRELRLSSCIYTILEHALENVPGTMLRASIDRSTK